MNLKLTKAEFNYLKDMIRRESRSILDASTYNWLYVGCRPNPLSPYIAKFNTPEECLQRIEDIERKLPLLESLADATGDVRIYNDACDIKKRVGKARARLERASRRKDVFNG